MLIGLGLTNPVQCNLATLDYYIENLNTPLSMHLVVVSLKLCYFVHILLKFTQCGTVFLCVCVRLVCVLWTLACSCSKPNERYQWTCAQAATKTKPNNQLKQKNEVAITNTGCCTQNKPLKWIICSTAKISWTLTWWWRSRVTSWCLQETGHEEKGSLDGPHVYTESRGTEWMSCL